MLRITEVVKHLLIINVLMFIASELLDFSDILALYFPASEYFRPYQVVSHFFMHGGLTHLFFNMFALWMFGSALEVRWGPKRFLFYYLVCAFGAALRLEGCPFQAVRRGDRIDSVGPAQRLLADREIDDLAVSGVIPIAMARGEDALFVPRLPSITGAPLW